MTSIGKLAVFTLLAASPVSAFAHGDEGSWQGHGSGMMDQEQMEQMHQNWSRMDKMMQQAPENRSPEGRKRLLEEHWEAMDDQMELMHQGMMGGGQGMMNNQGMMNGQGMMDNQGMMNNQGQARKQPGNAQGKSSGAAGMDYQQRMDMMENRMNQMQLMMEQMLEHQRQLNQN